MDEEDQADDPDQTPPQYMDQQGKSEGGAPVFEVGAGLWAY
jgi:hypothetical protein